MKAGRSSPGTHLINEQHDPQVLVSLLGLSCAGPNPFPNPLVRQLFGDKGSEGTGKKGNISISFSRSLIFSLGLHKGRQMCSKVPTLSPREAVVTASRDTVRGKSVVINRFWCAELVGLG